MLVSMRQPRKNIPVQLLRSYNANSVSLEMGACDSGRWTAARVDYEMELSGPSGERIQKFLSDRTRYSGVTVTAPLSKQNIGSKWRTSGCC